MRWGWIALAALGAVMFGLVGCAAMSLPQVKLDPTMGPSAPPPLLGPFEDDPAVTDPVQWEDRRAPLLRQAFAENVYGPYPPNTAPARVLSVDTIDYTPLNDIATVEQWSVAVGSEDRPLHFNMVVVLPKDTTTPAPLIIMENFCGNRAAFANPPDEIAGPLTPVLWVCDARWAYPLVEGVFGRYINGPPFRDIIENGYGVALFYAGDVVGDEAESAREGLARLYGDQAANAGAIAVWAWLYSQAYDVLSTDRRIDNALVAAWGHSRNGKAALLAAANDTRFFAVIAHQSGRGGASLTRSEEGESVAQVTSAFPWWFPPAFAEAPRDPALDQHQLLALIAPRMVLLGNGRRDAWSDPNGAWQAAQAANPIYQLYGVTGLDQTNMRTPNQDGRVVYFTRDGLHGVTTEDWRVFLEFLDTHMRRVT